MGRPAVVPAPRFALKMDMGQLAEEALLASSRVIPRRLEEDGYTWTFPELQPALADVTG